MKTGYYLFDAGLNYRDDILGINELEEGSNVYYRGNLKRRKGYEQRMAALATSSGSTQYLTSGFQIIDHLRLKTDSGSDQHFLFVSMADTAGATNAISVYYTSGIPTATSQTYTQIGVSTMTPSSGTAIGQMIPWDTVDPFSAVVMDDKVWIGLGKPDPYILFHDGTSWWIHEYPICLHGNSVGTTVNSEATGTTDAKSIIPGSTDTVVYSDNNGDWNGCNFLGAGGGYIYVSDGRTLYWGISNENVRADYYATATTSLNDRSSGLHTADLNNDPGTPGWNSLQNEGMEEALNLTDIEAYKKYIFLYGNDGIVSFYLRNLYDKDFDKITETREGVRGKMIATEKGVFYVAKDGIYGFDGQTATELSKKIWKQIDGQHSDIPDDFDECTLAYHDGFIWISFPNGINDEIYIFDPDHIYDDERGDSHAPFYRNIYRQNLIDRSDCESTVAPMVFDEVQPWESNSTFSRSNNEAYTGTYSYQIKKTAASGTVAYASIADNLNSADMHGLIAGNTYTFSARAYTGSSAGSYDISEVSMSIAWYATAYGSFQFIYSTAPTAADEWQRLTVTKTLPEETVAVGLLLAYHAGPSINEVCYFDDITLTCLESTGEDHNLGFLNLKEYDNHLYGVNDRLLYELDVEGMDEKTTAESIGINWKMKSAYHDQENPNTQKTYRQVVVETNEGIADGTTAGAYDFQFAASVEHSSGAEHRGISTGIDLEYTTDVSHVSKTLDIPEGSSGMILDGTNMSVELIGETDRVTPTSGDVNIYGFSLNWEPKTRPFEEVSS